MKESSYIIKMNRIFISLNSNNFNKFIEAEFKKVIDQGFYEYINKAFSSL